MATTLSFTESVRQHLQLCDDGTLDTVVAIGSRTLRFADTAEHRNADTGELDFDAFISDEIEFIEDDISTVLDEWFDKYSQWELEYRETHADEGNNYAHLLLDGDLVEVRNRLTEYVKANFDVADDFDFDDFWARVDLNDTEMRPEHRFGSCQWSDGITLDSYPIDEIESEIDFSHVAESTGLPIEVCIAWARSTGADYHCLRFWRNDADHCYLYLSSDGVWCNVLTDDTIETILDDMTPPAPFSQLYVEYNGWTNKATWCWLLWIDNDESAYRQKLAAIDSTTSIDADAAESICVAIMGERTPDHGSWYGGRPEDTDWAEIAEHLEQERKERFSA